MDAAGLVDELRAVGRSGGLDAVGVASAEPFLETRRHLVERRAAGLHGGMHFTYGRPERSTDPGRVVPGARALVVGARSYKRVDVEAAATDQPAGRVARYAWRDHYRDLRAALGLVARRLTDDGWQAAVVADDNALVDREAAYRAGLGWYGKNTNLLMPGLGSWFVLGSVVTDAPLPATVPRVVDGCGSCVRCIPACPTGALVAPGVLDARRCLAWLLQAPGSFPVALRPALGDRVYGCDDCQEVCPPNRRSERVTASPAVEGDAEPWVSLLDMLGADDRELLERHGRWYIPRREPRYLRRNALVALGNVGDGRAGPVQATLRRYLADPDPLLRAHAAWAARRLGCAALVTDALSVERDPHVVAELTGVA